MLCHVRVCKNKVGAAQRAGGVSPPMDIQHASCPTGQFGTLKSREIQHFFGFPCYCPCHADYRYFGYSQIKGATQGIKRYTPKLAICLYHQPSDVWEITMEVDMDRREEIIETIDRDTGIELQEYLDS